MEQLFKAVQRNASARDCTHTVQDPVAVVISQGKQNNTGLCQRCLLPRPGTVKTTLPATRSSAERRASHGAGI